MNIKDVTEGVKEEVAKRVRSPLVGAFIIAWAVLHYEFLFVVFSEGSYRDKNWYLASVLFRNEGLWSLFGAPALIALGTTALLPLLNLAADLWFQFVDVRGANLKLWMETGKRLSDPELRTLARTTAHERDSVRNYAKELHSRTATLTYHLHQKQAPGQPGTRVIQGLKGWLTETYGRYEGWAAEDDVKPELFPVLESVGFPVQGLKMLNLLQVEGTLSEDRLLRDCAGTQGQTSSANTLAFMCGAQLLDVIWESGVQPSYRMTPSGALFLEGVKHLAPDAFR